MSDPDPNATCLSMPWRGDFELNPDGSLRIVSGVEKVQQRFVRRLFTNPREILAEGTLVVSDYLFDQEYGLGATKLIGQPFGADFEAKMTQKIKNAALIDESVDVTQDPIVTYWQDDRLIFVNVQVFLSDGNTLNFAFPVQQ